MHKREWGIHKKLVNKETYEILKKELENFSFWSSRENINYSIAKKKKSFYAVHSQE